MPDSFAPSSEYVTRLLNDLKQELRGFHERIEETERIRYLEDRINMPDDEAKSGIEVRVGASAELIKNVKAAVNTSPPRILFHSTKEDKAGAGENEHKREQFHLRYLQRLNSEEPTLNRFVDSIVANGVGFLKAARVSYPSEPRKRLRKANGQFEETEKEHLDRVKALKRIWGPPFEVIDIHPLSLYRRRGKGNKIVEAVEHSWKPKPEVYRNYGIENQQSLKGMQLSNNMLKPEVKDSALLLRSQTGIPDQDVKSLPYGTDTSNKCLVTEYWSPDYHQIYVDRRLIYEEQTPHVHYFMALGEISSSNDPDKLSFGVAEIMRHNEPAVNRAITRMLEANELVGRKTAVETPEGSVADMEVIDGESVPKTYRFKTDVGVTLPPGAKIAHPFQGVEHVYQSMPVVQLLMSIMSEHGVSPLFKGMPVSSDASGYRENSLYMMAKSQLAELLGSYRLALTELIKWIEREIVDLDETVYLDELELSPADIKSWPSEIEVQLTPMLPQNMIAEGSFWDRMWASRHVSRRYVREHGFQEDDPAGLEWEVFIEDLKESLKPQLKLDIMGIVLGQQQELGMEEGELGPEQTPGDQMTERPGTGSMGREVGGRSRQGQPREPAIQPGAVM